MAQSVLKYPPSDHLWRSVVVKAVRIGWPAALEAAARHLSKSEMKRVILIQYFEDIFPHPDEVHDLELAVAEQDYHKVCTYETHHGKRWTEKIHTFSKAESEPLSDRNPERIKKTAMREYGWWINARGYADFWSWHRLKEELPFGARREVDATPWEGVPSCMADMHCGEGRIVGNYETMLSGTWDIHRKLGRMVPEVGWEVVRNKVHAQRLIWRERLPPKQESLF